MELFTIRPRWSWLAEIKVEIECDPATPYGVKLGLAVKAAIAQKADLSGADLSGADLSGAVLRSAVLRSAVLRSADLRSADLSGADLSGADLSGADLSGADLSGADLPAGIVVERAPLVVSGLYYPVTIWDNHMQIGCEFHALSDWAIFDDRRIAEMDGTASARFWKAHGAALLALAEGQR